MNINRSIAIGIVALFLAQPASAEVTKRSGENHRAIWVECLGDHIQLDWEFDAVITTKTTPANWMFTQSVRQWGDGVDTYGNSWAFRGHFSSTEHSDLTTDLWSTNFHLVSKDVMIADPGNPDGLGNLIMSSVWRLKIVDGEWVVELRDNSVSCLP